MENIQNKETLIKRNQELLSCESIYPKDNKFIGVTINDGEKLALLELCHEYGIAATYIESFLDEPSHHMWVIVNGEIGLCGTIIMMHLKTHVCGLTELKGYLKAMKNYYVSSKK